jgi:hypothetical protein
MADADFAYFRPTINGPRPLVGRVRAYVAECLEARSLAFVFRRLMTPVGFWIAKTRVRVKNGSLFLVLPKYPAVDGEATLTAANKPAAVTDVTTAPEASLRLAHLSAASANHQ